MKKHLPLGLVALASILVILIIVTVLGTNSLNGLISGGYNWEHPLLSERLCPPGTVSVYRSSPPLYRGGPAGQLNVVCQPADKPIEAEHGWFEHRYVPPFDRFSQKKGTRLYD